MQYRCDKCQKTMNEDSFYTYKNGDKAELCKKCMTMHINNFEPSTFLWILEKMDVPYIEAEWNVLRDRAFAANPLKMNGMSVIGKYLGKMRLKNFKDYSWADTEQFEAEKRQRDAEKLEQEEELRARDEELREQLKNGEITQAEYMTLSSTAYQNEHFSTVVPSGAAAINPISTGNNPYQEENFMSEDELVDPSVELTAEDKLYLAMKWGRLYKPSEWIELEKKYTEMANSFDIQDSDTEGTLILTCKTFLKMNQAIDCGDVDGFNKLSRTYEALRKSAKFTAAQNKEAKQEFVDCVGNLVAYCEQKKGQIPRHEITTPHDIIDKVIFDLKRYNRNLVYEDTALARQIEEYIQKRENAERAKRDREEAKKEGLFEPEISTKDHEEYLNMLHEEEEKTSSIYNEVFSAKKEKEE